MLWSRNRPIVVDEDTFEIMRIRDRSRRGAIDYISVPRGIRPGYEDAAQNFADENEKSGNREGTKQQNK